MSEAEAAAAPVATSPKKAAKSAKPKVPRAKPAHPKTADMVIGAIKNLKERGGSSLQAIKKYISANYKVDAEKLSPFIKKYIKGAVVSGKLVQTKGKGASGSFKLASKDKVEKVVKPSKVAAKKPKSPVKKAVAPKKAAAGEKKVIKATKKPAAKKPAAAPAAAKKAKSPSKAKKATKAPAAKKPKAPKPKKAAAKPKAAPKKAAPKKK
jgi:histone H1/5